MEAGEGEHSGYLHYWKNELSSVSFFLNRGGILRFFHRRFSFII